jgi:AraC-like DNA-binding protein
MARPVFRLAAGNGFAVEDLRILDRAERWSAPRCAAGYELVFVRRGLFRLKLPRWDGLVDPLVAYLRAPGAEQQIAHRPGREDACTVVTLDDALAADVLPHRLPARPLVTNARLDLAHRILLARARHGADEFELTDRVSLIAWQLRGLLGERPEDGPVPASHRRLADSARELLVTDPAWSSFGALAGELGVSRPHLSRVFRAVTGERLTDFRTRLRVRAALDRLEAGERNLAGLAAELGFADHAHLTRTLRAELGCTPTSLRALLRDPQP